MFHASAESSNTSKIILLIVFPLLIPIPIALKLVCAHIFNKFEFRTQTFRLLKINSVIDALSLLALWFMPFAEFKDLIVEQTNNKNSIFASIMATILIIGRFLSTLNAILNILIAWNQYKNLKIMFYVVICFGIVLSILLQLPNLLLFDINIHQSTNSSSQRADYFKPYVYCRIGFSFLLVMVPFILNMIFQFKIKRQRHLKHKSIIFTANIRKISSTIFMAQDSLRKISKESEKAKRQLSLTTSFMGAKRNSSSNQNLPHFRSLSTQSIACTSQNSKFQETKTGSMTSWLIYAFILDQLLRMIFEISGYLIKPNTNLSHLSLAGFLLLLLTSQLFQFKIYYKLNDAFSRRFNKLLTCSN